MRSRFLIPFLCTIFLACGISLSAEADIVFPAKLELVETSPGVYHVVFVLPVIGGKVIKAKPLLPESSEMLNDPVISGNDNFKILNFDMKIPLEGLSDQVIGIEGLAGNQIDILLTIQTLDGRNYEKSLSPVNPFFIVPSTPSFGKLLIDGIWEGVQLSINQLSLLFLFLFFLPKMKFRAWLLALGMASIGLLFGRLLSQNQYLMLPDFLAPLTVATLLLIFALVKTAKRNLDLSRIGLTILILILGISIGEIGQFEVELNTTGETVSERNTLSFFLAIGAFLGMVIYLLFARESRWIYHRFLIKRFTTKVVTTWLGILTVAYLVYQLSLVWNVPSMFPPVPLLLVLLLISTSRFQLGILQHLLLILCLVLGTWIGFQLTPPTLLYSLVGGVIGLLLLFQAFEVKVNKGVILFVSGFAAIACAWYLGDFSNTGLSFAIAQASGMILISGLIYWFAILILPRGKNQSERISSKLISTLLGLSLGIFWFGNDLLDFVSTFSLQWDLGKITIPILSLSLLLFAIFLWPRYRKIHQSLEIKRKKPIQSLALLAIGLFTISLTYTVYNPFYEVNAPAKTQAQTILNQVLDQTYRAFNLEDENELFEALDVSVTADLVDDIYLDSRRRLNVGLREGSEVLVQEVKVEDIGELTGAAASEAGFEYPATWTVTARVKHLQHIHYRQNKYIGQVKLLLEEGNWKIAKIVLTSEDRTIIAGKAL